MPLSLQLRFSPGHGALHYRACISRTGLPPTPQSQWIFHNAFVDAGDSLGRWPGVFCPHGWNSLRNVTSIVQDNSRWESLSYYPPTVCVAASFLPKRISTGFRLGCGTFTLFCRAAAFVITTRYCLARLLEANARRRTGAAIKKRNVNQLLLRHAPRNPEDGKDCGKVPVDSCAETKEDFSSEFGQQEKIPVDGVM